MKQVRYTLIKIPIRELISQNFDVVLNQESEIQNGYRIAQGDSLLFDQIARLRGEPSSHISEVILVTARKNPRQEKDLRRLLEQGFTYNGVHYSRFGKSASQGKEGITAFVCDALFDELYRITQMDIEVDTCVISKYEAQRCLVFSTCTLIDGYMPRIVIVGEYEKTLKNQWIRYVTEREKAFTDPKTGQTKTYPAREIEEGYRDLSLSPFDGCGCHEKEFMETVNSRLGLNEPAAGVQLRLPFIKGFSVYVPFRQILREWGYESITDIYGVRHPIDTIDCIWNTSMFKGHKLFVQKYGNQAWTAYQNTLKKYAFKLGISKYSHHTRRISRYTRMNFQYLQCLDLWNPRYIRAYETKALCSYDILDSANDGKMIQLARYTTALYEKIIKGDPFYACQFMGAADTDGCEPESRYLEAALTNDIMFGDPAVKQYLYRKLKKAIDEAKVGKIYCSGFYHTGVGDMIGYLQYAAGEEPVGCLKKGELYTGNLKPGEIVSFRSPLVDPSEVNRIRNVTNDTLCRWFHHFREQDIVMFNMYDISLPQQGGADCDGDIFLLSDDPMLTASKIEKPVILDVEDKATAQSKPYTKENIIEYEILTRDSRIGEITNAATSIENRYTTKEDVQRRYSDYASLLRICQGKEIDFLKTGVRFPMGAGLRRQVKQIPYFLLYHYPAKMKAYQALAEKQLPLNAYHSPSPMNELCSYICTWERKKILWDHECRDLASIRSLVQNSGMDLSDRTAIRICRRYINQYADEIKQQIRLQNETDGAQNRTFDREALTALFKEKLMRELQMDSDLAANYVIKASYASVSASKSFAWSAFGDVILANIKRNSPPQKARSIREVPAGTEGSLAYLGKYYTIESR